ncbi:hypothetical protein [Pseudomonas sp. BW7P1]|uniref:hypothetical protein n=1 Tax=Pseudomonas TaxID=286 RepID=UPI0021ADDD19|nr:hypothetical protein [Pseudomonas sp. BW7P1]UWI63089.1 hypothetical protein NWV16_06715 [Pseudomonas sp. BW7P1]
MDYQMTVNGVLRLSDSAFIPQDPANRDWLEYQQWLLSGGQVLPLEDTIEKTTPDGSVKNLAKKWLASISLQP